MCENVVRILHMCEESVPIFHTRETFKSRPFITVVSNTYQYSILFYSTNSSHVRNDQHEKSEHKWTILFFENGEKKGIKYFDWTLALYWPLL